MNIENLFSKWKCFEDESIFYLNRTEFISNKYVFTFYNHIINCIMADSPDFFSRGNTKKNYLGKSILNKKNRKNIFKWTAFYHTLNFLFENNHIDNLEMENSLFYIFDFTISDRKLFYNMRKLKSADNSKFEMKFSKLAIKDIFGTNRFNPFVYAFTSHYFINSYNAFAESYKKFMPVNIYS